MADTLTTNLKLRLPRLGKKPWKSDWDFNFTKVDQIVGGLTIDGSVCAVCAETIHGTALVPYIQMITGDLSGISPILPGETREFRVDHTTQMVFDLPSSPIFDPPADVNVIVLADRGVLTATEYGGVFYVRVENRSSSSVSGTALSWMRKGLKIS